ncbi:MAG: polymer-forming cytoskeletal protein [Chthoniobacterales bacterium]
MSFTAFGRGCEQNDSSSLTLVHPRTDIVISPSPTSPINIQSHIDGNGTPHNGETGNGHNRSNGNGHAPAKLEPRTGLGLRTTLSSGVSIKGIVKFRNELEIDGDVEGTIESAGRLTVGKNGRVRGDIQTRTITVHGTVDGNLSIGDKCELRSGCTLRGDIETSRLVMDENVNFTGSAAIATRDYLSELRPLNGSDNRHQHGHA